jgi:periplasmic protein CpxP/Spy
MSATRPTPHRSAPTRWLTTLAAALALGVTALPTLAQPDGAPGAYRGKPGPHVMHGMQGHHAMMGMPGMGPMFSPRLLDSVGATDDQKAQLRQIMDSARADVRALHDSAADQRAQARSLFAQPNVDARAAEALRQQMLARHDQASRRMMQAALDASRVLTPDQRQQMATLAEERRQRQMAQREQRREHMRQHRPERGYPPVAR